MPTLETLIAGLEPGPPVTSKNLRLVPLLRDDGAEPSIDYALASEAFDRGDLNVSEVHEEGVVAELLAVSTAKISILLIDGEELVGAKQNRILNTDVLLRARGKAKIPVSCVERGRWRADRPDFAPGGHSPSSLRARKSRSVSRSLREENAARSDQGAVWEDVDGLLACMGATSDTDAMAAAFEQRRGDLDAVVRNLPYPEDAVGVVALIDGEFAALDLFDRPRTLKAIWRRLVTGYAADAFAGRKSRTPGPGVDNAMPMLGKLAAVECDVFPGVDLGSDWRFDSPKFAGSALTLEGRAVHLSVFPGGRESRDAEDDPGQIASPSRRRRHRRGGRP